MVTLPRELGDYLQITATSRRITEESPHRLQLPFLRSKLSNDHSKHCCNNRLIPEPLDLPTRVPLELVATRGRQLTTS